MFCKVYRKDRLWIDLGFVSDGRESAGLRLRITMKCG